MAAERKVDPVSFLTRKIVELQRELETVKREKALSDTQRQLASSAQTASTAPSSALQQAKDAASHLETRLRQTEAALRDSQSTAARLANELNSRDEEVLHMTQVVRKKDEQIAKLLESITRLESQAKCGCNFSADMEESVRAAVRLNESLKIDLQTAHAECARLKQLSLLESDAELPRHLQLSMSRTGSVTVFPKPGNARDWVTKSELCGVQEDFVSLHRRYAVLRDEKNVHEVAAGAVGRMKEMEEDMEKVRGLVAQLRHDVESLFGWRVEFYGSSILLTMKYSNLSLELVRNAAGLSPEYRLAPSFLLRRALQHPEATHYLTQSKSFPAFLASLLLDYTGNTQCELQY